MPTVKARDVLLFVGRHITGTFLLLFVFSSIYAFGYRGELLSIEKNENEVLGCVRFSC